MAVTVALFAVAVVQFLALRPSEAVTFVKHSNMTLQDDQVTHTSVHARPCDCRAECYIDQSCGGYNIRMIKGRVYQCSFAAGNFTRGNLTAAAKNQGVATHLKGPPCPASFTEVPRAGCFQISSNEVSQPMPETSCPSGSQLYTPDEQTPEAFWALAGYLKYTVTQNSRNFWTSLTRNGSNFLSPSGKSISTVQGGSFWGAGEPNNPEEKCVVMLNYFNYGLADEWCHKMASLVCQKY